LGEAEIRRIKVQARLNKNLPPKHPEQKELEAAGGALIRQISNSTRDEATLRSADVQEAPDPVHRLVVFLVFNSKDTGFKSCLQSFPL
jgi:hypothetical protein